MRLKISLLFVALSFAVLTLCGVAVRQMVAAEQAATTTDTLSRATNAAALTLANALEAQQRDLTALANTLGSATELDLNNQPALQALLASHLRNGVEWLAVLDDQGQILATTTQIALGDNASSAVWFQRSALAPFISDQHALAWPANPNAGADGMPWGVLIAAPLSDNAKPAGTETPPAGAAQEVKPASGRVVLMLGHGWRTSLRDQLARAPADAPLAGQVRLLLSTQSGLPLTPSDSAPISPVQPGQCGLRKATLSGAFMQCTASVAGRNEAQNLGWLVTLQLPEAMLAAGVPAFDRQLLLAGALAALALALAGWWLAGRITRPMHAMVTAANHMALGERKPELTSDLPGSGPLGPSLNRLLTSLRQSEAEWVRTQLSLETRVEERTRELEKAVTELQEANTDLDRFASMVSHDLLAPVRAMRTFSELLLLDYADQLPPEAKRLLTRVDQAGQDMSNLVNALHALSKLGHKPLQVVPTDIQAVVEQTLRAHVPEWQLETIRVQPLPPCPCDPAMLRVVFDNLIGNAVKYSHRQTPPQIVVGGQDEGERCVYWVADNGAGFDPAYAHRLFQIFQRLHSQRDYPGTGVGLATVAKVVHRHGGKVWAEGTPNEGATFYFSLPKQAATAALPVTPASA